MLLAIDTSTTWTGLACYDASGLVGECVWNSGRNHTAQVLPQLTMLMHHLQRIPPDLHAIAVAIGPGSWSGLRVGISIAKGLAWAGNLPLIGISTLDALAYQHQHPALTICPLVRLGRERFATATFTSTASNTDTLQRLDDYRSVAPEELCTDMTTPTLFCGDLDANTRHIIQDSLPDLAHFPAPIAALRRPAALAHQAWQRHTASTYDNPATLEPIYLGEPVKLPES
jgi:tRNA threonylcarbamoyladenosine biosynthesis protein TsaB